MKLETLLTQITPLPWPEDGFDMPLTGTALSSAAELGATDYDYARHAANLFPELVKALEDLNETIEWLSNSGNLKSPIEPHPYGLAVIQAKQNARAILTRANEIKL